MSEKMTVPLIKKRKEGPKITMLTAYDAPSAVIVDNAGIDIILVGDSVGTTVLGHATTLPVTMDVMIHHTAAVTRTNPRALVVADLPWLSYHISTEQTVQNAGRLIREGQAEAVKLEGGRKRLPMIKALLDAEIPVMGHLGLTPQSFNAQGGYRVQGKDLQTAQALLEDAKALEDAGVFALVLEGIPDKLANLITEQCSIPTIGIGAGAGCDGQVLVFHDILGLQSTRVPRFVRQYTQLATLATNALLQFRADVESGNFPATQETYHMPESTLVDLASHIVTEEENRKQTTGYLQNME